MKMSLETELENCTTVQETDISRSTFMPTIGQALESSENGGSKRKLPSWQSQNKNLKTDDREIAVEDDKCITHNKAKVEWDTKTQISKQDGKVSTGASVNDQKKGLLVHGKGTSGQSGHRIGHSKKQFEKHVEENQAASKMEDSSKPGSSRKQMGKMPLESDSQSKYALQQTESAGTRLPFEKFLDGVIFALSGLVNPERANVREKALQMGAQYRPDWTSDCTLLVCAFANTPKFNQVMNDNGSIVSKDWILDCYRQKELLEIDNYLMHAGKPWRKFSAYVDVSIGKSSGNISDSASDEPLLTIASLQEVQKWVHVDVASSIAWLQQQENQPKPDEVKSIAIQGIDLCLEDTIKCLKNKQSMENIMNTWDFVPRAVRELASREGKAKCTGKVNYFADLLSEAERLKWIYATELNKLKASNGNGDIRDKISDDVPSETDSEATEILEEDDIVQAKEAIRKHLASESAM